MSRLVQRIEQTGREAPSPMGFSRKARQPAAPAMVLLASCSSLQALAGLDSAADAVLLSLGKLNAKALEEVASAVGDAPWGIRMGADGTDTVPLLKEKGCDFIAFSSGQIPLEALQDDELGRLLLVPSDIEKEQAHTLEELPLDAVICADPLPEALTLEQLMTLAAQRGEIGRPFFLPITSAPSTWELECLRDIGVDGLLLDLERADVQTLQVLRQRLLELPRRKARGDRPTPYIPRPPSASRQREQEPKPDEEEEEEDL